MAPGMAKLIVNPTSSSRREISLSRTIVSIGRDPSNDVVLPDAMVSRRHAVIEWRGSQYYLRDCNSSNGSLVNGDKVSERNLRDGDLVAIGTARLLFREDVDQDEHGAKVVQHPSAPRLNCPSCQADYRKGDLFCRQCGTTLAPPPPAKVVCTSCGTAVPLPARFCNACGHPLEVPASVRAASGPNELEVTKSRSVSDLIPGAAAPAAAAAPSLREEPAVSDAEAAPKPDPEATVQPTPELQPAPKVADPEASDRPRPVLARPSAEPPRGGAPPTGPVAVAARPPVAGVVRRSPEPGARAAAAPAGARLAAFLVDAVAVAAAQAVVSSPVLFYWSSHRMPDNPGEVAFWPILASALMVPVVAALGCVYYVYHWGVKGATPGKRLLGLAVQADDGTEPIGIARATIRVLGYLLSTLTLGFGFLMIAFAGYGLHDKLAGTRVVRRPG